ncbi:MAG: iron ABC transporter permease [Desulfurococcales archaeon]|nr:iron ABC transporter permease [Desulfurococcales archaeon]
MGFYDSLLKRKPRLLDLLAIGVILAVAYYAYYRAYPALAHSPGARPGRLDLLVALAVAALAGWEAYREGLDPYRLRFSSSLGFLTIYGGLAVALIVLLGLTGSAGAFSVFLMPLIAAVVAARAGGRGGREREASTRDSLILGFAGFSMSYLLLFLLAPLAIMLGYSFLTPHGVGLDWFVSMLNSPTYVNPAGIPGDKAVAVLSTPTGKEILIDGRDHGIILNSLINSTLVTIFTTILGTAVAAVLYRYDFPGKEAFKILVLIPMLVTPFINAYAIKTLVGHGGLLSMVTERLFHVRMQVTGLAGVTLAQTMAFYPIVYLNAYASFANIDPSMEEQAENLGARGLKLFFDVLLPLALPGIMAGSTLVFIYSLEDLGAPIVFQQMNMMSPTIYHMLLTQYGSVMPEIAALGVIMLTVALTGFIAAKSFVGLRPYAMLRQRIGEKTPRRLGWKGLLVVYLVVLPFILVTAYPQIAVALIAFKIMPPYAFKIQLHGATLHYMEALFRDPEVSVYLRNTFLYATVATGIIILLALTTAYAAARGRGAILEALDAIATLPLAIPGLVIAVGYFIFFGWLAQALHAEAIDPVNPNFIAAIPIIIAFSVRKLPFAARAAYAGLQQLDASLEEAAMSLGATRLRVLKSIVLPLVGVSLLAGGMISFIYCATEVSVSVTIGNLNPSWSPMTAYMLNQFVGGTAGNIPLVAAMGVVLMLVQLAALATVNAVLKQRYSFIGI